MDGRNLGRRVAAGGTALALLVGGLLLASPGGSAPTDDDACSMDEPVKVVTDLEEGRRQAMLLDRVAEIHLQLDDRWAGSAPYTDRPFVIALTSLDDLPPELTDSDDFCVMLARHTVHELEAAHDVVMSRMHEVWPPRDIEVAKTLLPRWQSGVDIRQNAVEVRISEREAARLPDVEAALADLLEQELVTLRTGVDFASPNPLS